MNHNSPISPEFSSAEAQRLYYLKQLGVFACYPRFVLPGALPSEGCVMPELLAPVSQAPSVSALPVTHAEEVSPPVNATVATAEAQKPAGILSRALDQELNASRKPAHINAPQPSLAAVTTPRPDRQLDTRVGETSELQFQMLLLQADKDLAICTQIPMLARQGLSEKEQRLLHNILLWLGCKVQTQTAPRRFTWPLPGLGVGTRTLAGKSLNGFLEQAQHELQYSSLILMGSSSIDCVEEFRAGHSAAQMPAWEQYTTHSLSEVLALPELKRSVWQQLLPLHARLSSRAL